MEEFKFLVKDVKDLDQVSDCLIDMSQKCPIVAFYGSMGVGKTTLIKNLCHRLNVTDEVNSPTFAIVNEYLTDDGEPIYHFDFYRIKKLEEAFDIGYENYFYSGNLCLIEWPEMIETLLPEEYIRVAIEHGDNDNSRVITCSFIK